MSRPLTIAHVAAMPFPSHQGSQVLVAGMARAQARRGDRVVVVCWGHGRGQVPAGVRVVRAARVPGGGFEHSGLHWSRPVHDLALLGAVRRAVHRWTPDVLHLHNIEAPLIAALTGSGPVHIVNPHTAMGEELRAYVPPGVRRVASWVGAAVDAAVARVGDAHVALSLAGADELARLGARRVEVVAPGVDLEELQGGDADRARARWDLGDRPWVLYAGNLDAYQDLDDLWAAMARVDDLGLLVVTGSPTDGLAARIGLPPDRLRVVRTRDFAEVKDATVAAQVGVVPRTRCVGFPMKLLNHLGVGLPVVMARGAASPLPGTVVVPNHAPDELAAALAHVARSHDVRAELAQAAREGVARDHTWDAVAERLDAVYRRVLADRR